MSVACKHHPALNMIHSLYLFLSLSLSPSPLYLFSVSVPLSPKFPLTLVHLSTWYLEPDGLVGLSGEQQVLPGLVWSLITLLIR